MTAKRLNAYLMLLTTAIIWGVATIIIKLTLAEIDPGPFLIYRFLISAVIALPFFILGKRVNIKSLKDAFLIFGYGFLSTTLALGLLFLGTDQTTVLNLTFITLSAPLFIELGGTYFFHDHLTKREKIGTAVAFLGTFLIVIGPIMNHLQKPSNLYGNILIILYLVTEITGILLLKKLLQKKYSSLSLTNSSFVIGLFTTLPIALVFLPVGQTLSQIAALPLPYHFGVWYMAIFSGSIAYYLRGRAQKTIEVSEASLFSYVTPVVSGILAVTLLGEILAPLFLLGAITVALGVTLAEYKPKML